MYTGAPALSGISKSQVSKLCKEIDERVHAFLDRLVHNAHRIDLAGDSLRRRRATPIPKD